MEGRRSLQVNFRRPRIRPASVPVPKVVTTAEERTHLLDDTVIEPLTESQFTVRPVRRRTSLTKSISLIRSASRSFLLTFGPDSVTRKKSIHRQSLATELVDDPSWTLGLSSESAESSLTTTSVEIQKSPWSSRSSSVRSGYVRYTELPIVEELFINEDRPRPYSPVQLQQVHLYDDDSYAKADQSLMRLKVRNL